MKTCKSCIQQIDDAANKCPHCQSYQVWYKNPQIFGIIFSFVFLIPLIFYAMDFRFNAKYIDNEQYFNVKELSHAQGEYNRLAINYSIENKTNTRWHSVSYELSLFDAKGNLLLVKTGQEYAWVIQPKQSSLLSVEVDGSFKPEKWKLKIVDMKSGLF